MEATFFDCFSLSSLNVKSFSTSSVRIMAYMFYNCHSLTSLDISNFNTSLVTDMKYMFQYDVKIKYLDLQYFNTSSVVNMYSMFYSCTSLVSLNLGNMDTSSVTNMAYMFYNCYSLTSLKIEVLNLSKLESTYYMFYNCYSLEYINLTNFNSNITSSSAMFRYCNPNLIYCIDDNKEYQILSELKNYRKSCSDMCTKYYSKKYIKEDNSCIDSCSTEIIYKYDFNNTCLENCPNNTILANDNVTCNLIEDNEKNITNNNKDNTNNGNGKKILIIIISIISGILILAVILFFIVRKCRKPEIHFPPPPGIELQNINVKIIFNFNQERTEIYIPRQTSLKNLIISYQEMKQFENTNMIYFIFDAETISYDDAINDERELSKFIPNDLKEKEILVYDWSTFVTQSSQN